LPENKRGLCRFIVWAWKLKNGRLIRTPFLFFAAMFDKMNEYGEFIL
jgi:hypothetical protein